MPSEKAWELVVTDQNQIISIIADAIFSANIDRPDNGDGTTRDPVYSSKEDSTNMAANVLSKLQAAGFEIRKKQAERP
ncbi:hypothetical protein [Mesorhizobium sp.]|uniref:hypothetical protein n=1 Tax=Mesorhizobium sp. TaxID=1871066 RepID=UPI000FE85FC5|nr:hypothetical protein [Mesorhizobium sp.]RWE78789.1 MAG: hypothetical protein EOS42_04190 [Mesorhizobium sp.]